MEDSKVIYLGPACQNEGDGREWCEDDVWPQCECGCSSVRYVLESDAQSELAALREENKKIQKRYEDMTDKAVEFEGEAESAELGLSLALQREDALREELAKRPSEIAMSLQTKLKAAEQRNSDLIDLIRKAHTWVDRNNFGGWDAYELRDQLAAALKPTESGASE